MFAAFPIEQAIHPLSLLSKELQFYIKFLFVFDLNYLHAKILYYDTLDN